MYQVEYDCLKLAKFIKDNNLMITAGGTLDMDGAYRIQENKKTSTYGWPTNSEVDLCLSFVHYSEGLTWDLWDEEMFSRNLEEDQFVKELEEKVNFWKKDRNKTENEFYAKKKIIDDEAYRVHHNL